jgi:hypothetical protein
MSLMTPGKARWQVIDGATMRQVIEAAIHQSSNSSKRQFIKAAIHQSGNSSKWQFIKCPS